MIGVWQSYDSIDIIDIYLKTKMVDIPGLEKHTELHLGRNSRHETSTPGGNVQLVPEKRYVPQPVEGHTPSVASETG